MTMPLTSDERRARFRRIADESQEVTRLCSMALEEIGKEVDTLQQYPAGYGASNEAVRKILAKLRPVFHNRQAVSIDVGLRRYLISGFPIFHSGQEGQKLHAWLKRAGIGGLTFLESVEPKEMSDFIRHFSHLAAKKRDRQWLQGMMKMSGISSIRLEIPLSEDLPPDQADTAGRIASAGSLVQNAWERLEEKPIDEPRKLYQVAVGLAKEILENASAPVPLRINQVNRIAANLIEILEKKSNGLVAMAIAGRIEAYPYLHPVNVAIFGAHMAASLYRERSQWIDLARIAFLYDIGKGQVPQEIIYKNGPLEPEERELLDRHPIYSADMLDRISELDKLTVVVAYEHHLEEHSDQESQWETNLFTRIVRVAEAFDAMIGNNLYRRTMPPYIAMKKLLAEWKDMPEAPLLGRLIQSIGLFPAGSVVTLSTDEVAVVVRQNRKDLMHPEVQVVIDRTGRMLEKADLKRTGNGCNITGIIPPDKVSFDPLQEFPF